MQQHEMIRVLVSQVIRLTELIGQFNDLENQAHKTGEQVQVALNDMKQRLAELMSSSGKQRIRRNGWRLSLHEEEDVEIDDPNLIPEDCVFAETEESRNPLWAKIRNRLRNGISVPGARLVKQPATVTVVRMEK